MINRIRKPYQIPFLATLIKCRNWDIYNRKAKEAFVKKLTHILVVLLAFDLASCGSPVEPSPFVGSWFGYYTNNVRVRMNFEDKVWRLLYSCAVLPNSS